MSLRLQRVLWHSSPAECSLVQQAALSCHPAADMHMVTIVPGWCDCCRELQTSDGSTLTLASLAGEKPVL